jgi:galactose mutarotase-like enzyme
MIILENEHLRIAISTKGAEVTSIFNKLTQLEHLWQADPEIWAWHAPNLFPVVGECMDSKISVDGISYPLKRHGFARNSEFTVLTATDSHAELALSYDESTLKVYPFRFQFHLLYQLTDRHLKIIYKVINEDQKTIFFAVGGHPAFNVPFHPAERLEEYYLQFEYPEDLVTHMTNSEGLFSGETRRLNLEDGKLMLTHELFSEGALVFKNLMSKKVILKSLSRSQYIEVSYPHFPYLALWKKGDAPFVCIEPLVGCADTQGKSNNIAEKEGIRKLEKGHVFEADYTISLY